jgi:hypothetical protein
LGVTAGTAWAQGQDSTTAERDIMVIAEMLPATYDNREQVYFDQRGGVPKENQHGRLNVIAERVALPAFGPYVFFIQQAKDNKLDQPYLTLLAALSTDKKDPDRVRMRVHALDDPAKFKNAHLNLALLADRTPANTPHFAGCDLFWRREAGQFRASTEAGTCVSDVNGKKQSGEMQMLLTDRSLWILDLSFDDQGKIVMVPPDRVFTKLNQSRAFQCHVDMPGVSGGRDEPFERYGPFPTVDQGGEIVFMTKEATPREMHVTLRNVDWQLNNETGAFTRDVLVMYLYSKKADGKLESYGYSFTEPTVTRTGINLGWMMVQCYMESNRSGRPEF